MLETIISFLPLVFIYYVGTISKNIYKLHKNFKVDPNFKIQLSPELKKININKQKLKKEYTNKTLTKFYNKIEESFPNDFLTLYYNNKNNLKLLESTTLMTIMQSVIPGVLGFYGGKLNIICLFGRKVAKRLPERIPYHELFHMSSCFYDRDKKIILCGFAQHNKSKKIGISLNEGYTEVMTMRYFNNSDDKQKISYPYELSRNISLLIEKIIGQENMEKLYMTANLNCLVEKLSIYDTKENAIGFIQNTDYIHEYNIKSNYFSNLYHNVFAPEFMIKEKLKSIQMYLISCYINKIKIEFNESKITKEEFKKKYINYIEYLIKSFYIKGENLNQIDSNEILDFINQYSINIKTI